MILKLLGLQRLLDELFDDEWLDPIALIEVWKRATTPSAEAPRHGWPWRWRCCKVHPNSWRFSVNTAKLPPLRA